MKFINQNSDHQESLPELMGSLSFMKPDVQDTATEPAIVLARYHRCNRCIYHVWRSASFVRKHPGISLCGGAGPLHHVGKYSPFRRTPLHHVGKYSPFRRIPIPSPNDKNSATSSCSPAPSEFPGKVIVRGGPEDNAKAWQNSSVAKCDCCAQGLPHNNNQESADIGCRQKGPEKNYPGRPVFGIAATVNKVSAGTGWIWRSPEKNYPGRPVFGKIDTVNRVSANTGYNQRSPESNYPGRPIFGNGNRESANTGRNRRDTKSGDRTGRHSRFRSQIRKWNARRRKLEKIFGGTKLCF